VKDRWLAEGATTREEARLAQIRRLERDLLTARSEKRHADVDARERLLAKVQGTEAPKDFTISAPGGGPVEVKTVPEVISAMQRLVGEGR
jgi:hypothetical protein